MKLGIVVLLMVMGMLLKAEPCPTESQLQLGHIPIVRIVLLLGLNKFISDSRLNKLISMLPNDERLYEWHRDTKIIDILKCGKPDDKLSLFILVLLMFDHLELSELKSTLKDVYPKLYSHFSLYTCAPIERWVLAYIIGKMYDSEQNDNYENPQSVIQKACDLMKLESITALELKTGLTDFVRKYAPIEHWKDDNVGLMLRIFNLGTQFATLPTNQNKEINVDTKKVGQQLLDAINAFKSNNSEDLQFDSYIQAIEKRMGLNKPKQKEGTQAVLQTSLIRASQVGVPISLIEPPVEPPKLISELDDSLNKESIAIWQAILGDVQHSSILHCGTILASGLNHAPETVKEDIKNLAKAIDNAGIQQFIFKNTPNTASFWDGVARLADIAKQKLNPSSEIEQIIAAALKIVIDKAQSQAKSLRTPAAPGPVEPYPVSTSAVPAQALVRYDTTVRQPVRRQQAAPVLVPVTHRVASSTDALMQIPSPQPSGQIVFAQTAGARQNRYPQLLQPQVYPPGAPVTVRSGPPVILAPSTQSGLLVQGQVLYPAIPAPQRQGQGGWQQRP